MLRRAIALAVALGVSAVGAEDMPAVSAQSHGNYLSAKPKPATVETKQQTGPAAAQANYHSGPVVSGPAAATDAAGKTAASGEAVSAPVLYRDESRPQPNASKAGNTSEASTAEPDRPATVSLRKSAYDFRLWDAGRDLITDIDADGYYRRFEIRFDADVSSGSALVYAKLYLRRVGSTGPWQHYFSTDDFWINGSSDSDDYYVETTLNDGYPTADYDVLVDLYEVGYSGIVATMGPFEDSSLRDLRLEDSGLDIPVPNAGYRIGSIATTLLTDQDRDGYYSRFKVEFDPDRDFGTSLAYAVLRVRAEGDDWRTEHTSAPFEVHETGDADRYSFTGEWLSGYRTARYDLQIDLYDAGTNLLVATVSSERAELSRVPLEDDGRDRSPNSGGGGGGGDSDSDGSGGGSMSLVLLGLAAGLIYARWHQRRDPVMNRRRNKEP